MSWNDLSLLDKIDKQKNWLIHSNKFDKYNNILESRNFVLKNKLLKNKIYIQPLISLIKNNNVINPSFLLNENCIKSTNGIFCLDLSLNKNMSYITNQLNSTNFKYFIEKKIVDKVLFNYMTDNEKEKNKLKLPLSYNFYSIYQKVCNIVVEYYDDFLDKTLHNIYDIEWNLVESPQILAVKVPKPNNLSDMIFISEMLSVGIDFVKIKLLNDFDDKIYFSCFSFGIEENLLNKLNLLWNEK